MCHCYYCLDRYRSTTLVSGLCVAHTTQACWSNVHFLPFLKCTSCSCNQDKKKCTGSLKEKSEYPLISLPWLTPVKVFERNCILWLTWILCESTVRPQWSDVDTKTLCAYRQRPWGMHKITFVLSIPSLKLVRGLVNSLIVALSNVLVRPVKEHAFWSEVEFRTTIYSDLIWIVVWSGTRSSFGISPSHLPW